MKTIVLTNPDTTVSIMLAKWRVDSGYERTCLSHTCCCMSHDSGYDWEKYEVPANVADYLEKNNRVRHHSGDVHSHGWSSWRLVACERSLRNRGESVSEFCKQIVGTAKETIRILRQLRLINREEMVKSVWSLAGLACTEAVSNADVMEAYTKLSQSQVGFRQRLEEQICADRAKECNSFLAPSQWAGLDSILLK